ncbi:hypothetical protein [Massilia sp. GCM10023247]|uniref:hypothetical protein n=1 Tax=Massilia sp. GCM10023247 TaxID=3252643 RepID=UPI00360B7983
MPLFRHIPIIPAAAIAVVSAVAAKQVWRTGYRAIVLRPMSTGGFVLAFGRWRKRHRLAVFPQARQARLHLSELIGEADMIAAAATKALLPECVRGHGESVAA